MSRRRNIIRPAQKKLRVGFVSPGLGIGGAERWVLSLIKYLDPTKIQISGVLSWCVTDPLSPEANRYCPLYGPWQVEEFITNTDTIIAWG